MNKDFFSLCQSLSLAIVVCLEMLLALPLLAGAPPESDDAIFNVRRYGATGDGQTLDTAALNKAISQCASAGGGTVLVPPGTYLSGPITLMSKVTLHLQAGAVIKATPKLEDYPAEPRRGSGESERSGLLTARNATDIAITGRGTLEGNGLAFMFTNRLHQGSDYDKKYTRQKEAFMDPKFGTQHGPLGHGERPGNLVRFFNCTNVLVEGVTIQNSPTWTVQVSDCERVTIHGVGINSFGSDRRIGNDDGIDLVNCRFVHISDCDIQTGDDCIAVFGSQQVAVSTCTLSSRSSAIRVGFTGQDIRDCVFAHLVIHDSNRGLGVYVRGAGSVENVLFSDITMQTRLFTGHWWGKGEPIQVSAVPWEQGVSKIGHIHNIRFRNITAESESGIVVYGTEQSPVQDLFFQDVSIRIKNSPLQNSYGGNFDLRSTRDFSKALFAHDIPAMFCKNVSGLEVHGLKVNWDNGLPSFFTHAVQCENFQDIVLDDFCGGPNPTSKANAAVLLSTGSGVTLRNCKAIDGTDVFLAHDKVNNYSLFANNDLGRAKKAFSPTRHSFEMWGNNLPGNTKEK